MRGPCRVIAVAALALAGCHVEPPRMPADEAARRSQAQGEEQAALQRQDEAEAPAAEARERRDAAASAAARVAGAPDGADDGRRVALDRQLADADARLRAAEAEVAAAAAAVSDSRAQIASLDEAQRQRERVWRAEVHDSAKQLIRIGAGLVAVGAVSASLGLYAAYLRANTRSELDTLMDLGSPTAAAEKKLSRQTAGMVAGLTVGLTLAAAGAVLLGISIRRKSATPPELAASASSTSIARCSVKDAPSSVT